MRAVRDINKSLRPVELMNGSVSMKQHEEMRRDANTDSLPAASLLNFLNNAIAAGMLQPKISL
ncbi:MAG TPA: hypothetical protein VET23_15730 [Chitinophagaceae bacterium]|nr:hypothetical protein [Chitinophagaceae bacterium]